MYLPVIELFIYVAPVHVINISYLYFPFGTPFDDKMVDIHDTHYLTSSYTINNLRLNFNLGSTSAGPKSSTLPHQRTPILNRDQRDRERDGYYSGKFIVCARNVRHVYKLNASIFTDRNELIRERERERERDRGYLSDHNSGYSVAHILGKV